MFVNSNSCKGNGKPSQSLTNLRGFFGQPINPVILCRLLFCCILSCSIITAAAQTNKTYYDPANSVYQYTVPVDNRRAYLWVPPDCRQVRGVIISLSNLLERKWLEDPIIRKTAATEGLGIIWVGPADRSLKKDAVFTADMKPGAGELLQKMLKDFADVSGYGELEFAPIISMGHSANGQFAWEVPNWDSARCIAAIPIKTMPLPQTLSFTGVPLCYVVGQTTEWPQYRVPDPATRPGNRDFFWPLVRESAMNLRKNNPDNLISVVVDPGGGHFDWSEHLARFVALFIRKACRYRLPENQPLNKSVKLNRITPASGWLTDTGGMGPDNFAPAPYAGYKGNADKAYWYFDKETALAAAAFSGDRQKRKMQMLTFVQDGKLLPVARQGFAAMKFEPGADGVSFKVKGDFLSEMPPELIGSGAKLGHAPGQVKFSVITGSAIQTGPDEFRIQFNRGDTGGAIWLQEEHPGNDEYRHAVQPAQMNIPAESNRGASQEITFPAIGNQQASVKTIKLNAFSDSKLPVNYYIIAGPAVIEGGLLKITQVPVRSKYPIMVTVAAYQWGQIISQQYQSAGPVKQSFFIIK